MSGEGLALAQRVLRRQHKRPPAHHVVRVVPSSVVTAADALPKPSVLGSYIFPNQARQSVKQTENDTTDEQGSNTKKEMQKTYIRTGFQNPWDSWHKPSVSDIWYGSKWWVPASAWAEVDTSTRNSSIEPDNSSNKDESNALIDQMENGEENAVEDRELRVVTPDFSLPDASSAKVTWLGHATALLQLPTNASSTPKSESITDPIRVLFDPIFSARCSPTQYFGPMRTFPAPCQAEDLPHIDVVVISHSHYDHLDYNSIVQIWQKQERKPRFVVPLGNKAWFLSLGVGIGEEHVVELDWWDETVFKWTGEELSSAVTQQEEEVGSIEELKEAAQTPHLRLICTPAQHGSGRYGLDASTTLWSSWTIEHRADSSSQQPLRVFFGGDTGYQYHGSPPDLNDTTTYTPCPAFAQVRKYLGGAPFHICLLPISVGATFSFVKSYDVIGVIPTIDEGLTSANHMGPQDAVRVARILGEGKDENDDNEQETLALAIHWGTFVGNLAEVKRSMRELKEACQDNGVQYLRGAKRAEQSVVHAKKLRFACLDHGDGLCHAMPR